MGPQRIAAPRVSHFLSLDRAASPERKTNGGPRMGSKGWKPDEGGAGRLEIQTRAHEGSWLVAARGEIDLATVTALEAELAKRESRPIILDLSGVSFIDSTGLTLLIRTAGRLTIGAVSATVDRLIQMCGLETELRFAE